MREHDSEPVPGLPERLPEGERLLWQGAPRWRPLARHAFHADKAALYCGALLVLHAALIVAEGGTASQAFAALLWFLPLPILGVGLLALLAWLTARTTVYTLTSRRLVLRYGIALPMTLNIPFKVVTAAALRLHAGGTGDIPVVIGGEDRIAYLHLWPHARPWRLAKPEPMLRAVPEAERVADILAQALVAASPAPGRTRTAGIAAPARPGGLATAAG